MYNWNNIKWDFRIILCEILHCYNKISIKKSIQSSDKNCFWNKFENMIQHFKTFCRLYILTYNHNNYKKFKMIEIKVIKRC